MPTTDRTREREREREREQSKGQTQRVEWTRLYREVLANNSKAFERLRVEVTARVARILRGRGASRLAPWELEEVALAAFETALLKRPPLESWRSVWSYILRMAERDAWRLCRRGRPFDRSGSRSGRRSDFVYDEAARLSVPPPGLSDVDARDEVEALLDRLPERSRRFASDMIDCFAEGQWTLEAIAGRLGVSVSTVQRRLRALKLQGGILT